MREEGGTNVIRDRECEKCRLDLQRQIEENKRVAEKRLDAHAGQINEMEKLMERVITLQEVQSRQLETSEKRFQLAEQQLAVYAAKAAETKPRDSLYKEKWFIIVVIVLCVVFAGSVSAAIGLNLFEQFSKIPKP